MDNDECTHRSVIAVPGGSDCEDCPMTWRPDSALEELYELEYERRDIDLEDEMAESYFDPDDMYGSFKY